MTHSGTIAIYGPATRPGKTRQVARPGQVPPAGKTGNYLYMSIAISEEHRALAESVAGFLTDHQSRAAARALLTAETEGLPGFWPELASLGLLGLHIPEDLGGSGFGLAETLVVAEQMGRHLAPGPFVPTVIASAVLAAAGPDDLRKKLLPGLADGSVIGAAALGGEVTSDRRQRHRKGRRRAQRPPGGRAARPVRRRRPGDREVSRRVPGRGPRQRGPEPSRRQGQRWTRRRPRCCRARPGC